MGSVPSFSPAGAYVEGFYARWSSMRGTGCDRMRAVALSLTSINVVKRTPPLSDPNMYVLDLSPLARP